MEERITRIDFKQIQEQQEKAEDGKEFNIDQDEYFGSKIDESD